MRGPENLFELHDYSNYRSSDYMSSTVTHTNDHVKMRISALVAVRILLFSHVSMIMFYSTPQTYTCLYKDCRYPISKQSEHKGEGVKQFVFRLRTKCMTSYLFMYSIFFSGYAVRRKENHLFLINKSNLCLVLKICLMFDIYY